MYIYIYIYIYRPSRRVRPVVVVLNPSVRRVFVVRPLSVRPVVSHRRRSLSVRPSRRRPSSVRPSTPVRRRRLSCVRPSRPSKWYPRQPKVMRRAGGRGHSNREKQVAHMALNMWRMSI